MLKADEIISWIHGLPKEIDAWLDSVESRRWGFYKDCIDAQMDYAFPASCVALNIRKIIAGTGDISQLKGYTFLQASENVEFIQSCQQEDSGFFIDPNLDAAFEEKDDLSAYARFLRPLTAYSIDLLKYYGAEPLYPYSVSGSHGKADPEEFLDFLRNADWFQPWGTCSHAAGKAREIFYLINDGAEEFLPAFKEGMEIILSHQNPETGMWGSEDLPLYQQISGALKVIGRFKFYMGMDLPYMDRLADSCISHHADGGFYPSGDDADMCFPRNVAEMCIACLEQSDYHRVELVETLISIAGYLREYQQPDGAFASQVSGRRFLHWNGARICGNSEQPRSNINGTQGGIYSLGMIGNYLSWPDMPFPDPQTGWRDRVAKLKYKIAIAETGKVEVIKK